MQAIYAKAARTRLAIFDVDGVLTDGSLYYTDGGEEIKAFHTLDGHGLKMLQESGVELAIITGRQSRAVELRSKNLGIDLVFQGVADKARTFAELVKSRQLEPSAASYMGDDVVDLPGLRRCGLSLSVPDAPVFVRRHVDYVTRAAGGHGAVREACELIMQAQGTLAHALEKYLE